MTPEELGLVGQRRYIRGEEFIHGFGWESTSQVEGGETNVLEPVVEEPEDQLESVNVEGEQSGSPAVRRRSNRSRTFNRNLADFGK